MKCTYRRGAAASCWEISQYGRPLILQDKALLAVIVGGLFLRCVSVKSSFGVCIMKLRK